MLKYTAFSVLTEATAKQLYQFLSQHHVAFRRVSRSQELETSESKTPYKDAVMEHSYNGMPCLRTSCAP